MEVGLGGGGLFRSVVDERHTVVGGGNCKRSRAQRPSFPATTTRSSVVPGVQCKDVGDVSGLLDSSPLLSQKSAVVRATRNRTTPQMS